MQANSSKPSWFELFALYKDPRLLRIFGLGMASGFPWVMIGSAMSAWLSEEGLSRTNIGFFGFIFIAYSINFLWSPLVDRVSIPFVGRYLGQRRSWIVVTQLIVAGCCWLIAAVSPSQDLAWAKFLALGLALAAATQDIAIDAFRIDSLPNEDSRLMSAGAAMATSGWWTGFAGLGAVPLILVDLDSWSWSDVYQMMAVAMVLLALVPLTAKEPESLREAQQESRNAAYLSHLSQSALTQQWLLLLCVPLFLLVLAWMIMGFPGFEYSEAYYFQSGFALFALLFFIVRSLVKIEGHTLNSETLAGDLNFTSKFAERVARMVSWLLVSFVEPLTEFFRRNGVRLALSVLLFIFLFKIGEAFLGRMSIVFYKEIGFSNSDIAIYSKVISWWVTIVFSLIGSAVTMRYGILRGLFVGGFAMAMSNLMFAFIALIGPSKPLLVAAVVVDGFTTAWSTVAFVAFLSMMCNRAFTASQYALMASLGTLGRTFLASYSGWLVDYLSGNWALFFALTALMVLPSLLFLYRIRHRLRSLSHEF